MTRLTGTFGVFMAIRLAPSCNWRKLAASLAVNAIATRVTSAGNFIIRNIDVDKLSVDSIGANPAKAE